MIEENKLTQINSLLKSIEEEKGIDILIAIESGSRAWGFPSEDSDYDIRVIYRHPYDWYVTPFDKKKVIQDVFIDDLDVSGWDVSKCLSLMYKGNASLAEWLFSPIVYRSNENYVPLLKDMASRTFNPKQAFYHYISLAKKKLEDERSEVNAKSFLYALRALLCAKWVAEEGVSPPVLFETLSNKYIKDVVSLKQLNMLIRDKCELNEGDRYEIPTELRAFALSEYKRLDAIEVEAKRLMDLDVYDAAFKNLLQ